jgi:tetratricopeptide (TPR) repeat protein
MGALGVCDLALGGELMTRDTRVATLVNRGILRMVRGDTRSADRDFYDAIALDPDEPEAWLNLGVSQLASGNAANAQQSADRAIYLGTRRPAVAYYVRGLAREMGGNVSAAYADLNHARSLEPNWSEPAMQLSRYKVVSR